MIEFDLFVHFVRISTISTYTWSILIETGREKEVKCDLSLSLFNKMAQIQTNEIHLSLSPEFSKGSRWLSFLFSDDSKFQCNRAITKTSFAKSLGLVKAVG